jgi:VanZ family protein
MRVRVPLLPRWFRWAAVVGLAAFIFHTSILSTPPEIVDPVKPDLLPLDKWRHFVAYAAFGGALAYATTDWDVDGRTLAVGVILVTVVYGIGIEFGQSMIPKRYFSLGDAYANALGGVLVVPYYLVRPYLAFAPLQSWVRSLTARN